MKYLICGDVHWSQYSSILRSRGEKYSTRLENLIKSVSWVESLADKNNCNSIIYLGDFFDRPDLNAEELTALQDVKWSNSNHIFIVGNHESNVNTLQFSSTKVFESIKADVISSPKTWDMGNVLFTFIPYSNNLKSLSEYVPESNKKRIVFAHADIAGIQYGRIISTQGLDIYDIEKGCTLFFDGHLHNGGQIGKNIILVGNLTGQNFNENAQIYDHNVYLLDIEGDTISVERYTNEDALKFYKLKIESEKDVDVLDTIKNNAVLSISCNNLYKDLILKKIANNDNILDHRMSIYYIDNSNSEESTDLFEVKDPFEQFILFAKSKLNSSPILDDELTRLKG